MENNENVIIPKDEFRKLMINLQKNFDYPNNKAAFTLAKISFDTLKMYDLTYSNGEYQ